MCLSQCTRIYAYSPIYAYKIFRVLPAENPKEIMPDREWGQCIEHKTRLMSLYQDFGWDWETTAETSVPGFLEDALYADSIGKWFFHSFKNAEDAVLEAYYHKFIDFSPAEFPDEELLVVKVEIPKDCIVFEGYYSGAVSYASNKLKLCGALIYDEKEIIDRFHKEGKYWG